jgi:nitrogen fixation-related uncharacterized protein
MNEATVAQTIMTLLILLIFLGFLIWGIKSGQFHNVEDAKYNIFHHNNDNMKGNNKDEEKRQ